MSPFPSDPQRIAEAIGIPIDQWPGNCHGVAEAVLRTLPTEGMRLVRGHFTGYVSQDSVYRGGPQQHSWLRLQDGRILDPTRWCMDRPGSPYLYCGPNENYDDAGIVLNIRGRASFRGSLSAIGQNGPEQIISEKLKAADPDVVEVLTRISGGAGSVLFTLQGPVEHISEPEAFYAAAETAGLKALIPTDNWVRVMEPERVTPSRGVNFYYDPPPRKEITPTQALFMTLAKFLSLEERENTIEAELEELGYTLDDLHEALNQMEKCLRHDPDLVWMPSGDRDLICMVAMDLLGKGFGEDIRVERYADSLGLDRQGLDNALRSLAGPAGLDLYWIYPPRIDENPSPCPEM